MAISDSRNGSFFGHLQAQTDFRTSGGLEGMSCDDGISPRARSRQVRNRLWPLLIVEGYGNEDAFAYVLALPGLWVRRDALHLDPHRRPADRGDAAVDEKLLPDLERSKEAKTFDRDEAARSRCAFHQRPYPSATRSSRQTHHRRGWHPPAG